VHRRAANLYGDKADRERQENRQAAPPPAPALSRRRLRLRRTTPEPALLQPAQPEPETPESRPIKRLATQNAIHFIELAEL